MAFCNERLFKPTAVVVPSWPMNCWKALGPKCVVFAFLSFLEPYFAPNLTLNSLFLWKIREILNLSFFAPFDIFWDGHGKNELEIIKFIHKLVISLIIWCPWRSTGGRLVHISPHLGGMCSLSLLPATPSWSKTLKDFLSWHDALRGPTTSPHTLLSEL